MSRPSDHIDAGKDGFEPRDLPRKPRAGRAGGSGATSSAPAPRVNAAMSALRVVWRQLTSMRVALLLLLLLAIAAVPGSLVPQRLSDPNGVTKFFDENPDLAKVYDAVQLFDVYSSAWFTAIYLLLFLSLVGCIIPRIIHHWRALRSAPPATPARLERLDAYSTLRVTGDSVPDRGEIIAAAKRVLDARRYRTVVIDRGARGLSVSAERGYLRETGNLVFHIAMLGILLSVGILGGMSWHGQRVLVEGQTFTNGLVSYSSFTPGRFFSPDDLQPYSVRLDSLEVAYEQENQHALGLPIDYDAGVTVTEPGQAPYAASVKVNQPLRVAGTDMYLLGNGYAPHLTVRNADGAAVFEDTVPFIPQDTNLTGLGVVKVPDGLTQDIGMIGFFYPTAAQLSTGAFTSSSPELADPLLTLNVYTGDLGLDSGIPQSVYRLDTSGLTQIAGGKSGVKGLQLRLGDTVELPNGLGTVTFDAVPRYASFDIQHDPTQLPVFLCASFVILGLLLSLLVPRRRIWVKATPVAGGVLLEYAGLARGEDPKLVAAVNAVLDAHAAELVGSKATSTTPAPPAGSAPSTRDGAADGDAPEHDSQAAAEPTGRPAQAAGAPDDPAAESTEP